MVRKSPENDGRIAIIEGEVTYKRNWTQFFRATVWNEVKWSSLHVEVDNF